MCTSEKTLDSLFAADLCENGEHVWGLLFEIVGHLPSLGYIDRRHQESRQSPGNRSVQRVLPGVQLHFRDQLRFLLGLRLQTYDFESLIQRQLDGAEGNFAHNEREVALVKASKPLLAPDVAKRLRNRREVADLHVLLDYFEGIADESLRDFRKRSS